jgi:hypothetical protein
MTLDEFNAALAAATTDVDKALAAVAFTGNLNAHYARALADEILRLRDEQTADAGVGGSGLRSGRPEHLTLEAAEQHAAWLRERSSDNLTVVAKLMLVLHDEVLRLRKLDGDERAWYTYERLYQAETKLARVEALCAGADRRELNRCLVHVDTIRDALRGVP